MSDKQISEKQLEANKKNAAKSTGPKTPAGKAASSQNARIHGFTATTVVLSTEDRELYEARRQALHAHLKPVDILEIDLVDELASARWRQQRCIVFETAIIDRKIDSQSKYMDERFGDSLDNETRGSLGANSCANMTKGLRDISLYEYRNRRTYEKALKELQMLQKLRFQAAPPEVQPETPAAKQNPQRATTKKTNEPILKAVPSKVAPFPSPKPVEPSTNEPENDDPWPLAA